MKIIVIITTIITRIEFVTVWRIRWSGILNNGNSWYRSSKIKENRSKQRGKVNSWPNLCVCQIWLKNNLPLGRYGQNCDFSKWRPDDVTDETSHCYREYLIMRKLWRKFGLIWSSRFWVMEEWKFACVCLCICACVRLCEWNTELVIGYIHSLFRYWQNQIMILPSLNAVFMVKLTLEDWEVCYSNLSLVQWRLFSVMCFVHEIWRTRTCPSWGARERLSVEKLTFDLTFMCAKYGWKVTFR